MTDKNVRIFNRLIKKHRKWFTETAQSVCERYVKGLNEAVAKKSANGLRASNVSLSILGLYYGVKGSLAILDGDSGGWSNIHRGCHYYLWSLAVNAWAVRHLPDSPNLSFVVPRAGCTVCYAIACDLKDWVRRQTTLLSDMAIDPLLVDPRIWKVRKFEPFAQKLGEIAMANVNGPFPGGNFGPYSGIFDNWNDEQGLADSLRTICNYHLDKAEDHGNRWDSEFDNPPFDLVPWEMFAISAIRSKLGLKTPVVDHPLMTSPLAKVDLQAQFDDPLLANVIALFEEHSPNW